MTAEVFVFLGEFGYELLDWQGRLRRYAKRRPRGSRLICAGRPGVASLYEFADAYIDVSRCPAWQASTAIQMTAFANPKDYADPANDRHLAILKRQISALVAERVSEPFDIFFSCDRHSQGDIQLGSGVRWLDTQIYDLLPHWENDYAVLECDESTAADDVLLAAGVDPREPFILVQFRERELAQAGTDLDIRPFLEAMAAVAPVAFIEYSSGRGTDSFSRALDVAGVKPVPVPSLAVQGAIIRRAAHCIFFAAGDIGTHFYLPPFFDRDVTAVAPASCYGLGTSPIPLWNLAVFPGRGRLRPEPVREDAPGFSTQAITERIVHEAAWRVWLDKVERLASNGGRVLWPNTPINRDIQNRIKMRVGAADVEGRDPRSRPARIVKHLQQAVSDGTLPGEFGLVDLACGDAIILAAVKRVFPTAYTFGIDCNTGRFPDHPTIQKRGVRLYRGWLQHLHKARPGRPFDVIMMLNTYRNWDAARLAPEERELPGQLDELFRQSARHLLLTLTRRQLAAFEAAGWLAQSLGPGEDDSLMVFLTNPDLPARPGGVIGDFGQRCTGTVDQLVYWLTKKPEALGERAEAVIADVRTRLEDCAARASGDALQDWYRERLQRLEKAWANSPLNRN